MNGHAPAGVTTARYTLSELWRNLRGSNCQSTRYKSHFARRPALPEAGVLPVINCKIVAFCSSC